ncbi:MAG: TIGR02452 family protein, partial [Betaproteobacteria bacterium]|nr:TIGR02452 family protein [Betaproteobacteria bacterium]
MTASAIVNRARTVVPDQSQGKTLQVVPILGPSHDQPPYELLRQETLAKVQVTEVSQAGSVPELQVTNGLDVRVYLMDGQELVGAKQNRILNTDVLVPAGSTLKIPVSCVEQGRWHHTSMAFMAGKSASHRTRTAKMTRVHASLKQDHRHDADQQAVWQEVAASIGASGAASPTHALADAYTKRDTDLSTFRRSLRMP